MSLIRKHGAVLQAWACLDLVGKKMAKTIELRATHFPPHLICVNALPC